MLTHTSQHTISSILITKHLPTPKAPQPLQHANFDRALFYV